MRFGDTLSTIGDATLAGFDLPTAQRLYNKEGRLDEIAVSSNPNVSPEELTAAIEGVLPPTAQVRTGQAQATEEASETNEFITFLQGFLLAFAGIALFVGSFVIANSLAITIAQRTREFATIRTIGASRKQVLGSIILEALVVGILASVIGLFLGLGLATVLFKLFDAVGFTLPNTGLVFQTRTIVVALSVGIVVTLLASLRPAIRATRVPPIAAVREGATLPESRFAPYRTVGASVLTLLGFAAILYALFAPDLGTTSLLLWLGLGALLVFVGIALLSVKFIRPLAYALGWPATKMGGAAGALARDNARQEPAADRLDCLGVDDRARARHARRRARGGDHVDVPRRRRGSLDGRRLRRDRAEQLLADPRLGGREHRGGSRRRGRRRRPHRRCAGVRQIVLRHGREPAARHDARHGVGRGPGKRARGAR